MFGTTSKKDLETSCEEVSSHQGGTPEIAPQSNRGNTLADQTETVVEIPQWRLGRILVVWAAAAVPMGILAWVVGPAGAPRLSGDGNVPMAKALFIALTAGLIWQFGIVAMLVWREQHSLRWSTVREALWLRPPRSPRTGRRGGRIWWVLIPLVFLYFVEGLIPSLPTPGDRDLAALVQSSAGESFFHGAWGWFALTVVMWVFNTVLGEELLFRGLLLPRMNGAFGRGDWVVNGVLFAVYHLHMPWRIPTILLDALILAYPTKRYHSAWIGIAVHSSQSLFFGALVLTLVL
jgi:membrane protease YdiL (CAAX protease family)